MTDDLEKYEALRDDIENIYLDGALALQGAKAITELVAMVREGRIALRYVEDVSDKFEKRAEAAERELAELKRRMREPDADLCATMIHARLHSKGSVFDSERAAWLAAVNHLLGGNE